MSLLDEVYLVRALPAVVMWLAFAALVGVGYVLGFVAGAA